jgi:hypothetical protein
MRGAFSLTLSQIIGIGLVMVAALAPWSAQACPYGSQFFAWGGEGGCVADGKQVMKCYHMGKTCPSGWSNEGESEGKAWCCPPPPRPKGSNCVLRGTAPFCDGECEVGETLNARTAPRTQGCVTGSKAWCCR